MPLTDNWTLEIHDGGAGGTLVESYPADVLQLDAIQDIFERNGYLDRDGNQFVFDYAQIEPNRKLCIYVKDKEDESC